MLKPARSSELARKSPRERTLESDTSVASRAIMESSVYGARPRGEMSARELSVSTIALG